MGQGADDAVAGLTCSWCGIFFEKEHGYPVICKSCWKDSKPNERVGVQKAHHKEM